MLRGETRKTDVIEKNPVKSGVTAVDVGETLEVLKVVMKRYYLFCETSVIEMQEQYEMHTGSTLTENESLVPAETPCN